jgi:hypothetical protein
MGHNTRAHTRTPKDSKTNTTTGARMHARTETHRTRANFAPSYSRAELILSRTRNPFALFCCVAALHDSTAIAIAFAKITNMMNVSKY